VLGLDQAATHVTVATIQTYRLGLTNMHYCAISVDKFA